MINRIFLLTFILAMAGCGGGGSGTATPTPASSSSASSASAGSSSSAPTSSSPSSSAPAPSSTTDVLTYKYDGARTGQNITESVLTPANVNTATFGLLRNLAVDGKVDAQPLYTAKLTVNGAAHNVVFVATEAGSVYAFDSDSGATVWKSSLLGSGETTSDDHGCSQVTPQIGVTSTPVIDRSAGAHGTLFVIGMTKDASGNYHQRLHALDLATGAELLSGPKEIAATYGSTSFAPGQYEERAALLLTNGTILTSWTSHCDQGPYGGWIIAYSETSLAQTGVLNVGAGASGSGYAAQGPAIWMAGGGPAVDAAGNVYVLTGNGPFETTLTNGFPSGGDYGNSFVKISGVGGTLTVADYFTLTNGLAESQNDQDLGSGGLMLLPDEMDAAGVVHHLVVGAGKDGNLYVVSRDAMGKYSPSANNIWQQLNGALGSVFSTPAYFNGTVFYGPVSGALKAFSINAAQLSAVSVQTTTSFPFPGTSPVVSANGTSNGVVWAYENASPAVLHAYDALNLAHELYNSNQAANARDQFGAGNKFIAPTVADGKVFVGTQNSVGVFGLL